MQLPSYPKVYTIGHRSIKGIFSGVVTVQEKVDGSQFSFGIIGGELLFRSKGAVVDPDNPPKDFKPAVEYVKSMKSRLTPGWVYRGETLARPKHNVLAYDRVPQGHVIIFDIMCGLEDYLPYQEMRNNCLLAGFEPIPELYAGFVTDVEQLKLFLDKDSVLGGQKIEGFVVKNIELMTDDKKMAVGKFVSESFKEVHSNEWKSKGPGKDFVLELAEKYQTPARWNKAIQHLREAGMLDDSPKDIGPLLKEINRDVIEECGDDIKEALFKHYWKIMNRAITKGFPEWYKNKLMEEAFDV